MSTSDWFWRVELTRPNAAGESCTLEDISGWFKNNQGGAYLRTFENEFAEFLGAKHAIAVSSGSAALYVALKACGIRFGDRIAVPTYTHVGSVAPIILAGATPIFIDVDEHGNISPQDLLAKADQYYFGAIIIVHQLGTPCKMREITEAAKFSSFGNKFIIEDASHALGSAYGGEPCGLLGNIGCFSIGGGRTKTIGTGEGGMIVTDNDNLAEKCRNVRNHGDRSFDVDYFCFNFRMSDLNAAVGLMHMDKLASLINWQIRKAGYLKSNLPRYLEVPPLPPNIWSCQYLVGCHFNQEKAGMTRDAFLRLMKPFQVGPRKYVGGGYSRLISDVKYYSNFARGQTFPMSEKLRDESVWIDWHRYPRTNEEIDVLLEKLKEIGE